MEVLTDNKNSVDFDDSDIERQIEEELNALNLDDIEDDDDDENTDNIVEDYGNDEVSHRSKSNRMPDYKSIQFTVTTFSIIVRRYSLIEYKKVPR